MNKIFQDVLYAQRFLSSAGLYHGKLDGRYGSMTKAAEDAFELTYNTIKSQLGTFDVRTEQNISTLLPKTQILARKFMKLAYNSSFQVKIISGTRTYAEQNVLYNQRNPRVTKAPGGHSNHNFGLAWDVGIFVNNEYYDGYDKNKIKAGLENKAYVDLAKMIRGNLPGIELGIDWKSFSDAPHYQLATGKTVSQCRALLEAGKSYT